MDMPHTHTHTRIARSCSTNRIELVSSLNGEHIVIAIVTGNVISFKTITICNIVRCTGNGAVYELESAR